MNRLNLSCQQNDDPPKWAGLLPESDCTTLLRRLTRASAIRSLETAHRDSFAKAWGKSGKARRNKQLHQRQIEATDRQIDALVYELYGLTEAEIKIVEGNQ